MFKKKTFQSEHRRRRRRRRRRQTRNKFANELIHYRLLHLLLHIRSTYFCRVKCNRNIRMPNEVKLAPPSSASLAAALSVASCNGYLQSEPETSTMLPLTSPVVVAEECCDAEKHHALLCRGDAAAATLEAGTGSEDKKSGCFETFLVRHDKPNSGNRQRSRRHKTAFQQVGPKF